MVPPTPSLIPPWPAEVFLSSGVHSTCLLVGRMQASIQSCRSMDSGKGDRAFVLHGGEDKVNGGAGIQGNGREGADGYRLPTLHLAFSTCFGFSFPRSRSSGKVWGHVACLGGEPRKL